MNLLLDTHVVIWWVTGNPRIKDSWAKAIKNRDNAISVSAATVWEVEIKKHQGRLPFHRSVIDIATEYGFELLSMTSHDAALAGSLDWDHRDPFDRMLAAQSLERGLTLVTDDAALLTAPGIRTMA